MSCVQGLQDWMLVLAVFFLVGIDVVILLIYTIIEGSRGKLEAEAIQNPENPSVEQGVSMNRLKICTVGSQLSGHLGLRVSG